MEALKEFTVPLTGLRPGDHTYTYKVGAEFFKHFESSPLENGNFEVGVVLDRRQDMAVIDFDIKGSYQCACDRCLAEIYLPVTYQAQLILKFEEGEDSDDVVYLDPQTAEWNAARIIYELIVLARPLNNVYDCQGKPCDQEMLKKLNLLETEESKDEDDSVWGDLKNIKLN